MVKEELNLSIIANFVVTVKCEYNEKQLFCIIGFEKIFPFLYYIFFKIKKVYFTFAPYCLYQYLLPCMMNCAWFVLRRGQSKVTERVCNDITFYPVKMCRIHDVIKVLKY